MRSTTDGEGNYFFEVEPGDYYLRILGDNPTYKPPVNAPYSYHFASIYWVEGGILSLTDSKIVILLLLNVVLLLVGTFMDMTPAVLIFTPIFLPIAVQLGMSPLHFGIVMVLNLCIGLCTPPVGSVLFVGCGIAGTSISKVLKPLLPLYLAMIIALLLVTYLPQISLFLPRLFGF